MLQALHTCEAFYSSCQEETELLKAFAGVMGQLSDNQRRVVVPGHFLDQMGETMREDSPASGFQPYSQHDVNEVLPVLIDQITRHSSRSEQLTRLVIRRTKTCTVCLSEYATESKEPSLTVPVRSSLTKMVEHFSPDEILEGQNAYQCENCGMKQKTTVHCELASAPKLLLLVMRRMEPLNGALIRSRRRVKEIAHMRIQVREAGTAQRTVEYETLAVIRHEGTADKGHYTAHIKRGISWFLCNDSVVTRSSPDSIGDEKAYVVLCSRKTAHTRPDDNATPPLPELTSPGTHAAAKTADSPAATIRPDKIPAAKTADTPAAAFQPGELPAAKTADTPAATIRPDKLPAAKTADTPMTTSCPDREKIAGQKLHSAEEPTEPPEPPDPDPDPPDQ